MTMFLMDEPTTAKIKELADYAVQHSYDLAFMKERARKSQTGEPVEKYAEEHTLVLPTGFLITYTIEQHPGGWMRHLSMSSPARGKVPNQPAIEWVMGLLGYTKPLERCVTWPEHFGDNQIAINVLEPFVKEESGAVN
jgi:hypothetical protein